MNSFLMAYFVCGILLLNINWYYFYSKLILFAHKSGKTLIEGVSINHIINGYQLTGNLRQYTNWFVIWATTSLPSRTFYTRLYVNNLIDLTHLLKISNLKITNRKEIHWELGSEVRQFSQLPAHFDIYVAQSQSISVYL